jgi:NAD+-dependent protein deacetylase sirtuin 4
MAGLAVPDGAGGLERVDRVERDVDRLVEFLQGHPVVVLTGAGCSTESGIPDYRGEGKVRRPRTPMLYQEFMGEPQARARYWSRSAVGWPRFSRAGPNAAHRALARMEASGVIRGVITQNVDGLHQAAGSRRVLDLHGSLARVRCMACGSPEPRTEVQERLRALNPGLDSLEAAAGSAPDGDAELPAGAWEAFQVPSCRRCQGVLKPDVVFFGENVPRDRVERAWSLYEEGDRLLVVGSSLTVFSGRRFVIRATREGLPVAILNVGPTRGDEWADLKVEGRVGEVLPLVAHRLGVL